MKKILSNIASFCSMLVMGALIGLFLGATVPELFQLPLLQVYLVVFSALLLSVVPHVAIHEAGHLVCGLLSGYRFVSYRLFSFLWKKENGKLVMNRYSIAGTAGQCLMDPPDGEKTPFVLYNLGGGLANFLLSLICILLGVLFSPLLIKAFFFICASYGIFMGLVNLIPMRTGMLNNDGMNLLELLRYPQLRPFFFAQLRANALLSQGASVQDLPASFFEVKEDALSLGSLGTVPLLLSVDKAFAEEDWETAYTQVQRTKDSSLFLPGVQQSMMKVYDYLLCYLTDRPLPDLFQDKGERNFLKSMARNPQVALARYIHEGVSENSVEQQRQLTLLESVLKSYPFPAERTQMEHLLTLVQEKQSSGKAVEPTDTAT